MAEMNVHALMNELDQKDNWYPRKNLKCENLYTKSMESCPIVIYSGRVSSREGELHNFA